MRLIRDSAPPPPLPLLPTNSVTYKWTNVNLISINDKQEKKLPVVNMIFSRSGVVFPKLSSSSFLNIFQNQEKGRMSDGVNVNIVMLRLNNIKQQEKE